MNKPAGNLFTLTQELLSSDYEVFQEILSNEDFMIERIISTGQKTPEGKWLEQDRDEWVVLLQGESKLAFQDGEDVILRKGDSVLIPSNRKHRVEYTSKEPPCIWLAFHGKLNNGH